MPVIPTDCLRESIACIRGTNRPAVWLAGGFLVHRLPNGEMHIDRLHDLPDEVLP